MFDYHETKGLLCCVTPSVHHCDRLLRYNTVLPCPPPIYSYIIVPTSLPVHACFLWSSRSSIFTFLHFYNQYSCAAVMLLLRTSFLPSLLMKNSLYILNTSYTAHKEGQEKQWHASNRRVQTTGTERCWNERFDRGAGTIPSQQRESQVYLRVYP